MLTRARMGGGLTFGMGRTAGGYVAPAPSPPANLALPVVTGTPKVGNILTASVGFWTGSPSAYAYQWYADGIAISGATSSTVALTEDELGAEIGVGVVATNGAGDSVEALSEEVGPVAAADALVAPVLTKTSAAGTNPMSWRGEYTNASPGDVITRYATVNGTPLDPESHTLTEFEVIEIATAMDLGEGYNMPWPVFAGTVFADGAIVVVWETHTKASVESDPSNELTDTMAGGSGALAVFRDAAVIPFAYGTGPYSFNDVAIESGDKVVVLLTCYFTNGISDGDAQIASLTANSGAISFAQAGSASGRVDALGMTARSFVFWAATSGVTELDLSLTTVGVCRWAGMTVIGVKNAASGAPASTACGALSSAGTAEYDVDGGLSADGAEGEVLVIAVGYLNGGAHGDFTGATKYAEGDALVDDFVKCSSAYQTTPAAVTIGLGLSGHPLSYAAAKFEAA